MVGVDPELIERASTSRSSVKAIQTYFGANGIPRSDGRHGTNGGRFVKERRIKVSRTALST